MHRDVKPGNLLVSDADVVKLADFGIARATDQSSITQVGSVLGTAAYLAPEQARGEEAGPRADIYSLGVVAYQLLSGRLPYEATSLSELALKQQRELPTPLDQLNRTGPARARAGGGDGARDRPGGPSRRRADVRRDAAQTAHHGIDAPAGRVRSALPGRRATRVLRRQRDAPPRLRPRGDAAGTAATCDAAPAPARRLEPRARRDQRRPRRRGRLAGPRRARRRSGVRGASLALLAAAARVHRGGRGRGRDRDQHLDTVVQASTVAHTTSRARINQVSDLISQYTK